MTVHRVIVQLRAPAPGYPGQVSDGYYAIEGDTLVMTYANGEPVSEDQFRHRLRPGDDPNAVAGELTKLVRRHLLGLSADSEAFGRPLGYQNLGIA